MREVTEEALEKLKILFTHDGLGNLVAKDNHTAGRRKRLKGDKVGGINPSTGYHRVRVDKKDWYSHRVLFYFYHNIWPFEKHVDHIDGDKTNNKKENLRIGSHRDNQRAYKTKNKKCSSIYRGVSWKPQILRWVAKVGSTDSKGAYESNYAGCFTSEKEAALAYNYKAQEMGFSPEAFNQVFEDVSQEMLRREYGS